VFERYLDNLDVSCVDYNQTYSFCVCHCLQKGNPLKLVIMSATLRLKDFTENSQLFKVTPPVVKVTAIKIMCLFGYRFCIFHHFIVSDIYMNSHHLEYPKEAYKP